MNHSKANNSIKCSVSSCAHHNSAQSACNLSSIQVGCCGHGMCFLRDVQAEVRLLS